LLRITTCWKRFGRFARKPRSERETIHATLRSLVENEVQVPRHHSKANRQRVAKALGLSEPTLSEKLTLEDTSFDHVVDRLR